MAVVRRVMVVRKDGKCIIMVGGFLMLYEGIWVSLRVELEWVVRLDSKRGKGRGTCTSHIGRLFPRQVQLTIMTKSLAMRIGLWYAHYTESTLMKGAVAVVSEYG